jgi:hypothetical protein
MHRRRWIQPAVPVPTLMMDDYTPYNFRIITESIHGPRLQVPHSLAILVPCSLYLSFARHTRLHIPYA